MLKKESAIYELYLTITWMLSIYSLWLYQNLLNMIKKPPRKEQINVEYLVQSIRERPKGSQIKIQRNQRNSPSNSIRRLPSSITKKNPLIHLVNLGPANKILSIDRSSKSVTCEPGVTMEELVDELLQYDLIPVVVPEFKLLTVGGILAGAGLESSSFRYGQFADSLTEATYILSDGRIVTCSPTKDSDLFYGALGSCGTFGLLIRATLRVLEVKSDCFVRCNYLRTNQPIESLSSIDNREDYIDAIVFLNYTVIITGKRIDKLSVPQLGKIQRFSRSWDPWYYQHVKKLHRKNDLICEYIPLKDYLFRYDRGAFWMGRYPINPLQDKIQHFPLFIRNLLNLFPFGGYNIISRTILSPVFTTSSLYKRLHASEVSVIADTLLIQDIYIPISKSKEFLSFLQSGELFMKDGDALEPIWLCPIRSNSTPQKMSPHYFQNDEELLFINFGLWTHRPNWQLGSSHCKNSTKILEKETKRLGGRKMLYSLSYYSREEWSNIYDIQWYQQMKTKWDADYAWGDIYDKIVQK